MSFALGPGGRGSLSTLSLSFILSGKLQGLCVGFFFLIKRKSLFKAPVDLTFSIVCQKMSVFLWSARLPLLSLYVSVHLCVDGVSGRGPGRGLRLTPALPQILSMVNIEAGSLADPGVHCFSYSD